ncbi:MAG: hypothetical protein F6K24_24980 [Okeania sp. SIO2D1]|nr:hypothetical protein [Okeania sp. SIO2D1]
MAKSKSKKYTTPGNPELDRYYFQAENPEKAKNKLLAVKVDEDTLGNIKNLPNWQDKVRAKLEELLQEERAGDAASG